MGDHLLAGIPSRYITSQLGNSALRPSGVAKLSTNFGWSKGWNVTSARRQVTLSDPIRHVNSSSGLVTSVSELLYPCYFTLLSAAPHLVFSLQLFCKRTFGDKWHGFLWAECLDGTQPSPWKHWGKFDPIFDSSFLMHCLMTPVLVAFSALSLLVGW